MIRESIAGRRRTKHEANFSCVRAVERPVSKDMPASTNAVEIGLFAFCPPVGSWMTSHVPAWAHRNKHRPITTRWRAEPAYADGDRIKVQWQAVKTNAASNRTQPREGDAARREVMAYHPWGTYSQTGEQT